MNHKIAMQTEKAYVCNSTYFIILNYILIQIDNILHKLKNDL